MSVDVHEDRAGGGHSCGWRWGGRSPTSLVKKGKASSRNSSVPFAGERVAGSLVTPKEHCEDDPVCTPTLK